MLSLFEGRHLRFMTSVVSIQLQLEQNSYVVDEFCTTLFFLLLDKLISLSSFTFLKQFFGFKPDYLNLVAQ